MELMACPKCKGDGVARVTLDPEHDSAPRERSCYRCGGSGSVSAEAATPSELIEAATAPLREEVASLVDLLVGRNGDLWEARDAHGRIATRPTRAEVEADIAGWIGQDRLEREDAEAEAAVLAQARRDHAAKIGGEAQ